MSAGTCERCSGDGVHPSRHDPTWLLVCLRCKGTGNYPPPPNPIIAWWYRVTDRIDKLLARWGVL